MVKFLTATLLLTLLPLNMLAGEQVAASILTDDSTAEIPAQMGRLYNVRVAFTGRLMTGKVNIDLDGYQLGRQERLDTAEFVIPCTTGKIDLWAERDSCVAPCISYVSAEEMPTKQKRAKRKVHHIGDSTSAGDGSWAKRLAELMQKGEYPELAELCDFCNDGQGGKQLRTLYTIGRFANVLRDICPDDVVMVGNVGTNNMNKAFREDLNFYLNTFKAFGAKIMLNSYTPHGAVSRWTKGYDAEKQRFDSYRRDAYDNIIRKVAEERVANDSDYLGFIEIGKSADAAFNAYVDDYADNGHANRQTAAEAIINCYADHNHYHRAPLVCDLILNGYGEVKGVVKLLVDILGKQEKNRRQRFHSDATHPVVHDPVMACEDGRYYIFSTGMYLSSMHSDDMQTWTIGRPVMPEIPQWATDSVPGYRGHTWAPDIQRVGDTWYMYYSCSTFGKNSSAIGLMTSKSINPDSPLYRWEDRGVVVKSTPGVTDRNAIDPNMILDEEGNPWLTWGSFWDGIQLVRLGKDFVTPIGHPQTIARRYPPKQPLEQLSPADRERASQAPNAGANAIEAPFLIREGDYYYLFASWDYCCKGANSNYKTVVGRSRNIEGPYLDRSGKPMTEGGGEIIAQRDEHYYGIGHNAAYKFDGQWYFIAHGYAVADGGMSKLVIKKMRFDKDGWPVLEESKN